MKLSAYEYGIEHEEDIIKKDLKRVVKDYNLKRRHIIKAMGYVVPGFDDGKEYFNVTGILVFDKNKILEDDVNIYIPEDDVVGIVADKEYKLLQDGNLIQSSAFSSLVYGCKKEKIMRLEKTSHLIDVDSLF